jgi:hypothetical protein
VRRFRLVDLAALVVLVALASDAVAGPADPDRDPATARALPGATAAAPASSLPRPTSASAAPSSASPSASSVAPPSVAPSQSAAAAASTAPSVSAAPSTAVAPTPAAPTAVRTPAAYTPAPVTPPPAPAPLSACPIFPASNVWNRPVDTLPVAANSATMVAAIGLDKPLHPDFSDGGGYGIPYNVVGASTPRSTVSFEYDDESDHVGYPIPASPRTEGGSDRHLLMVETNECRVYELFAASQTGSVWTAGSGATWDLRSNALRPETWTSADAAGLPIFPGLVRHDDVAAGEIRHAIRFTAPRTCDGYVYPARHEAGSGSCATYPPMGLRVRLRADVDLSGFGPQARVVLAALQRYGAILADNGSAWYITGAPSSGWDDDELHDLHAIVGANFEVVDTTGFVNG